MKTKFWMMGAAVLLTGSLCRAQEAVMHSKEVTLAVEISSANVKLSRADYSEPVVKVLIPELAGATLLDHRNNGEGAPCMATYDTGRPEDVIQGKPAVEKHVFKIELRKSLSSDVENKVCRVALVEEITADIRGFKFTHSRSHWMPDRHLDDCK